MNIKKKKRNARILRAIIQLVFFCFAPAIFTSAFSGIKYIFEQFGNYQAVTMNTFLWVLIFVGVFTICFGRYFCGYACAFGSLGDAVYALSGWVQKKTKKKLPKLSMVWVRRLQIVKYLILALIVLCCFLGVFSRMASASPWTVFSMIHSFHFNLAAYVLGIVLLILILVGMCFQDRFFCQFLCPMGAVFALLPVLPWSALDRNREECIPKCSACMRNCPVHLEIAADGQKNGECIQCGACINTCPKSNVHFGIRKFPHSNVVMPIVKGAVLFAGFMLLTNI